MTTKAEKVDYVKSQSGIAGHTCHWPGCTANVPPVMWGCKFHWFKLPRDIRNHIWKAFQPGQEVEKAPSTEYLAAAESAQVWIAKQS